MATQAETDEILALEQLHQAAQARLGLAAATLSLAEWQAVNALHATETAAEWLAHSLRMVTAVRKMSRALAISYYQLTRALGTGRTLGVPEGSTGGVTLGLLRSNFRNQALDIASFPSTRTRSDDPDIKWFEDALAGNGRLDLTKNAGIDSKLQHFMDVEGHNDSGQIPVDSFDWTKDLTLEDVTRAYEGTLQKGIDRTADDVKALRKDTTLTPDQAITQIEKAHEAAGSIGSGTVDAIALEGGRSPLDQAMRHDRLVKLVARGTSGNPCAFCAMLASRGFVYAGDVNAGGEGFGSANQDEIKKFHIHCHCFPIVRFERVSQLPDLNIYFREKWNEVTKGKSGQDAVNAFRRWIYAARKANPLAPHGVQNQ